jgi:hypothetical protein
VFLFCFSQTLPFTNGADHPTRLGFNIGLGVIISSAIPVLATIWAQYVLWFLVICNITCFFAGFQKYLGLWSLVI